MSQPQPYHQDQAQDHTQDHTEVDWQELLREAILFGLLFKAAMVDLDEIRQLPLKLSYQFLLEELSQWAERQHHRLWQRLRQQGCQLLTSKKEGSIYAVQVRIGGYRREVVYAIEVLRAECQERIRIWVQQQGERQR